VRSGTERHHLGGHVLQLGEIADLFELKVPLPAVMEIMGWSDVSIAKRYMHVPSEFLTAIADQVSGLVWAETNNDEEEPSAGTPVSS
jgi:site-specific recombinase XerD